MHMVPPPPAAAKIVREVDVETYRNYFLVKFRDHATGAFTSFEMYEGKPLNVPAMLLYLRSGTNVTFNGINYDMVMISAAATGRFTNDMLKNLSDYIITTKPSPQPWMVAKDWGFELLDVDHIDLINVAPGQASLKIYGGRLHCKKMQDLPYAPDRILTRAEMIEVERYCGNDLVTTADLYDALEDDLETRIELSAQYGVDMRSKSDAQIAEAAFKKLLNLDSRASREIVNQAQVPPGSVIKYTGAPFLKFSTPQMQDAYARCLRANFVISNAGQPLEPPELDKYEIRLGDAVYRMGIGGLHSSEKSTTLRAGPDLVLMDFDVASYYPKIISILRLFPKQLGPVFLEIYNGWIAVRLEYKNKGQKKKAATFKIKLNGTFGKTNSKYSIIFSPQMFLQIVLTGQLSLLMLIDMMYTAGIGTAQTNTDGVVIKCRPDQVATRDAIVKQWEALTGFEMEGTPYVALCSRDVNNYFAFKPGKDGGPITVKTKGAYADDPISRLAKNPTNAICIDAVKEYIINGTPLETTIRRCDDIRKFVSVKTVKGGGEWVKDTIIADTVGQKREALRARGWTEESKGYWRHTGDDSCEEWQQEAAPLEIAIKMIRAQIPREYLGKAVRWYYGRGQTGHIAYADNGNLVGKSEEAKPCMDLPDVLPPDINYEWYIEESRNILRDIGIIC